MMTLGGPCAPASSMAAISSSVRGAVDVHAYKGDRFVSVSNITKEASPQYSRRSATARYSCRCAFVELGGEGGEGCPAAAFTAYWSWCKLGFERGGNEYGVLTVFQTCVLHRLASIRRRAELQAGGCCHAVVHRLQITLHISTNTPFLLFSVRRLTVLHPPRALAPPLLAKPTVSFQHPT